MAAKKYETILVEKSEGITWVTFNRPDKRNAMSPQLHLDMDDVLDDLAIDDETEFWWSPAQANPFPPGRTSGSISAAPRPTR
jgi:trans-feruloyl-CoA hydratase/vanillin synthase